MSFKSSPSLAGIVCGLMLLGGCSTKDASPVLRATDVETNALAQQAKSLFELQRPAQAAPLYQAALSRSRASNNDAVVARLAYNLGACLLEIGDAHGAVLAFEESIHAARSANLPDGETQLLLGYALLKQGETERVFVLCQSALESKANADLRIRFQLLRAEAYLEEGQTDRAAESLQEVAKQGTAKASYSVQAQAAQMEGVILLRREDPSGAADAFQREARFWGLANRPMRVVIALVSAANEHKRANDRSAEADARYRAARALASMERFADASMQLELVEAMPEDEWPSTLKPLVPHLRQEIEKRTPTTTAAR